MTHCLLNFHGTPLRPSCNLCSPRVLATSPCLVQAFGDALVPFIRPLAESDGTLPFESQQDIPVEVLGQLVLCDSWRERDGKLHRASCSAGAVICDKGKLTPPWAHIASIRADSERIASMAILQSALVQLHVAWQHTRTLTGCFHPYAFLAWVFVAQALVRVLAL
eukprot:1799037-Amphidinium_carterae.1